MKFSACCTTRNKSALLFLTTVAFACAGAQTAQLSPNRSQGDGSAAASVSPLQAALDANDARQPGKTPYHVLVQFQVMGLTGVLQETGTAEQWWAGASGSTLKITSPSLGTVQDPQSEHLPNAQAKRVLFLVNQLLSGMLSPRIDVGPAEKVLAAPERLGDVNLSCLVAEPLQGPTNPSPSAVCLTQGSEAIRLVTAQSGSTIRNRVGSFAGTKVGLDTEVSYFGRVAIRGSVESLKSFDPATESVQLVGAKAQEVSSSREAGGAEQVQRQGQVRAGRLLRRVDPVYPAIAKNASVAGQVLLAVQILKTGSVADSFPVATQSTLLDEAATAAVDQWVYQPYLLDGIPVDVNTVVMLNFGMHSH